MSENKIHYAKMVFSDLDINELIQKIYEGIENIESRFLDPRFVLVSKESYPILSYGLNNYRMSIKRQPTPGPLIFIDSINLTGKILDIVIVDLPNVELGRKFLEVIPTASNMIAKLL